jgi:phosphatidylserine/phosphatidylglycerophosphate/cardiolipin synthase-like enzyme
LVLLRTGAANFSASGLKRQDNDLVIIENPEAAAAFRGHFEAIFAESEPLPDDSADRSAALFRQRR